MTATTRRPPRLIDDPDLLRERLRAAPQGPGVYVMRDLAGRVAYVGKADVLQNRLRSYFTGIPSLPERTRRLVEGVFDFEVIACASPREALILENTLIKRHRPRFNVRLKDDKNYLYLKIPAPGSPDTHAPGTAREKLRAPRGEAGQRATLFPRPYYTRKVQRDGARYYGPYTSAQSLRTTVRSLRTIFPFRTCGDELFRRGRVCLDYHIRRCSGPCEGRIDEAGYARLLEQVETFMEGRSRVLADELRQQMEEAAAGLDYELAARFRDRLRAIDRISERQDVLSGRRGDHDAVAVAVEAGRGMAAVLTVRGGRVIGSETHEVEGVADLSPAECLGAFLPQFYSGSPQLPRVVLISDLPEGLEEIAGFLSAERDGPVEVRMPRRGELRRLVDLARETALAALRQRRVVEDFDAERTEALLGDLAARLELESPPRRIECYDISNTMGTNSVGSMVVFEDGRPRPDHYRHFGIRTVEGADDFASMAETLRRRFVRHLRAVQGEADGDIPVDDPDGSNGEEAPPERGRPARRRAGSRGEESFAALPDLLIIDGGRGQLGAAHDVLVEAGLADIPVFGLAKRNEELFRPDRIDPIVLPRDSPTLFLVQRVRDEAHRFAITRHRARRAKSALRSRLDVVPGLGPVRKRALLRRFGSVEAIGQASVEELAEVVPEVVAQRIKELV
ncbi:MAG: excinuclease ABC subunit UvrC [Candidatus Dormibacteria bacterium]